MWFGFWAYSRDPRRHPLRGMRKMDLLMLFRRWCCWKVCRAHRSFLFPPFWPTKPPGICWNDASPFDPSTSSLLLTFCLLSKHHWRAVTGDLSAPALSLVDTCIHIFWEVPFNMQIRRTEHACWIDWLNTELTQEKCSQVDDYRATNGTPVHCVKALIESIRTLDEVKVRSELSSLLGRENKCHTGRTGWPAWTVWKFWLRLLHWHISMSIVPLFRYWPHWLSAAGPTCENVQYSTMQDETSAVWLLNAAKMWSGVCWNFHIFRYLGFFPQNCNCKQPWCNIVREPTLTAALLVFEI